MGTYDFGEKREEYNAKLGKSVEVWQSPKYTAARDKAVEILDSGKYELAPADFWILMNATKSGKMAYTGLIVSHNGCLKINDKLASPFVPSCVALDKGGYRDSLVFSYCNDEQGIFEVGEVSAGNCKNDYPYAMAYKRLFDRVVLKLSKLAYAGIYSDSEADEFAKPEDDKPTDKPTGKAAEKAVHEQAAAKAAEKTDQKTYRCFDCGEIIIGRVNCGKQYSGEDIAANTAKTYGVTLCWDCARKRADAKATSDEGAA